MLHGEDNTLPVSFLISFDANLTSYYNYGLVQRKSTGSVDTTEVYSSGRYFLGPDKRFLKYQADAHMQQLDQLGVFSGKPEN